MCVCVCVNDCATMCMRVYLSYIIRYLAYSVCECVYVGASLKLYVRVCSPYIISDLVCPCLQVSQLIAHVSFIGHLGSGMWTSGGGTWKREERTGQGPRKRINHSHRVQLNGSSASNPSLGPMVPPQCTSRGLGLNDLGK